MAKKKELTKEELKEKEFQDKFCEKFKTDILEYDLNQKISSTQFLRLKGLLTGKFIDNNNIESTCNYTWEVLYYTLLACSMDIKNAKDNTKFKDEKHKFNYFVKIVENNINDIYMKLKRNKQNQKREEVVDKIISPNYNDNEGIKYSEKEKNDNNNFVDVEDLEKDLFNIEDYL